MTIKRILAYTLFLLGFLTITFFRNYGGTIIPYPSLFWLIGLIMWAVGWGVLRYTPTSKEDKDTKSIQQIINDLKTNGEKIKINFAHCEIKENNYLEQKEIDSSGNYVTTVNDYDIVRALTPHYMHSKTKTVQVNQSVIIYTDERLDSREKFISSILPYERITLMFKLDMQKTTTLYVDKQNRSKYYFDLEFLFT